MPFLHRLFGATIVLPALIAVGLLAVDSCSESASGKFPLADVATALVGVFEQGPIAQVDPFDAAAVSMLRVALCCAASSLIGLALGCLLGFVRPLGLLLSPSVDFVRGLPITFLLVPLIWVVGITKSPIPWVLSCVPCSLIVLVCVYDRTRLISSDRSATARSFFGGRGIDMLRHFYFQELKTGFAVGLRLATPYAVIVIGVLEYVGAGSAEPGFGTMVQMLSERGGQEPATIAAVIWYGFFGLFLLLVIEAAEGALLRWQGN